MTTATVYLRLFDMAPLSNLMGPSAVSLAMATFAPKASAAMPMSSSERPPAIVAHAAAEGGKIKMYSNEYYATCGFGG